MPKMPKSRLTNLRITNIDLVGDDPGYRVPVFDAAAEVAARERVAALVARGEHDLDARRRAAAATNARREAERTGWLKIAARVRRAGGSRSAQARAIREHLEAAGLSEDVPTLRAIYIWLQRRGQ